MRDLITKEETKELFNKKIRPQLSSIETERKKIHEEMSKKRKKNLIIAAILFIVALKLNHGREILNIIMGIAAFIIYQEFSMFQKLVQPFRKNFKEKIIAQLFTGLIGPCKFSVESFVTRKEFDESQVINKPYNAFYGEDLLEGNFQKMKFKFSEVRALKVTKTKKGPKTEVQFAGLFFSFNLPFDSCQKTLILHDYAEKTIGRLLGRIIQKQSSRPDYELVQLESVNFEKEFAVYSNDQVQSRKWLTPVVLENLISFKKKYKDSIGISIQDKKLYVAISSKKNHFEPKMDNQCISMNDVQEIYDIFLLVRDLLEDFEIPQKAA